MQYDYLIYMFLFIGFIFGLYRGIKRELSFFIVFSISTFIMIYFYPNIKELINKYIDITSLYEKSKNILNYANISCSYLEFLICGLSIFILINIILNSILYLIFFNGRVKMMKEITPKQRFFGGILGIVLGFELSIVMMIILSGVCSFDLTSSISSLILKIKWIEDIINSIKQLL